MARQKSGVAKHGPQKVGASNSKSALGLELKSTTTTTLSSNLT
jgi:hypothetical protein